MRLSKIMDYYGSKYAIAHLYGDAEECSIVEPFAGGAGFSLLHYHKNVFLYDLDERVVRVWDYVINASYKELASLPLIQIDQSIDDLECCEEAKLLISCWLQYGKPFRKKLSKRNAERSQRDSLRSWSSSRREYIARTSKFIKHWEVHHSSFRDIDIEKHSSSLWFIDPPYFNSAGKEYKFGSHKLSCSDLLQWVNRLEDRFIVCENTNSEAWMNFKNLTVLHGMSKSNTEVYFSNQHLISTSGEQLSLFQGS